MSAPTSKGTALITGASTGIGAVYADRLAKRGYDLILVARSQEKLSEVAARLKSTGRRIETISADLTEKEDVRRVAERLSADPTITALVNNAGAASVAKLLDSKIDDLEAMIHLNVTALTRLVEQLPSEIVMTAEDMVDASLAGLDQHELITIPSLPDIADWETYEAARKALGPNLSRQKPAARYGIQS